MGATLFLLILNSTIWAGMVVQSPFYAFSARFLLLLQPVMDLSLWLGLRSIRRRAGLKPGGGAALSLLFWHILVLGLAFANANAIFLMVFLPRFPFPGGHPGSGAISVTL